MKKINLFFTLFFTATGLLGQNGIPCHSDEIHFQLTQEKSHLLPVFEQKRKELNLFTEQFSLVQPKAGPYIIPVVFHVIHMNGEENISEEQIRNSLMHLNEQFNKRNADTTDIIPAFKGIAADVQVEFRLAKLDPDGNCTNGINRIYSETSAAGDHSVKSIIHWPREKYLNIYVCKGAAGLAGHALMPPVADTIPEWDGIVMMHDYVGAIGTSQWLHRTVLTHEVGHYLNLYHIWGGNNVPDFYYLPVAQSGNCAYDDEVADTPNTIGWQTCNINGSSCGGLNNVQNFMDYSYCSSMFTEGQKLRIHAALNSPVAQRNNLWQTANLIATGVADEGTLCFADFELKRPYACLGDTVEIFDRSYHHVQTRAWNITNATIISQQDSVVKVVFNQEGKQNIELTVSDGTSTLNVLKENIIEILPSTVSNNYIIEDFEDLSASYRPVLLNDKNLWKFSDYAASGSHGYWTDNYGNEGNIYDLVLRPVNLTNVPNPAITFDRAFARLDNSEMEVLEIQVSNTCGATWTSFRSFYSSSSLKTVSPVLQNGPYIPANEDWALTSPFAIPAAYKKAHTMIRFLYQGKGDNNLYIDNINISDKSSLNTINPDNAFFAVYPNPVQNSFTVELPEITTATLEIFDITGKLTDIHQLENANQFLINTEKLNNGLFLIKLSAGGKIFTGRLIIEK
ncbi:MAG: zinc-dependent metalloprotease [Flavobacteriia bacterium]|nr:zinc-dependent metalloprotease [Flavobacteriia bacterium]